jgi:hypothetical protein
MTIDKLSKDLTREFGKGYSATNLEYFRRFYLLYENRISQSTIGKLSIKSSPKKHSPIPQSVIGNSEYPFSLSWTHYIQLLKIEDKKERDFYEIEAVQNNWSVRELTRQFNAALYERLALSRDKNEVKDLAQKDL